MSSNVSFRLVRQTLPAPPKSRAAVSLSLSPAQIMCVLYMCGLLIRTQMCGFSWSSVLPACMQWVHQHCRFGQRLEKMTKKRMICPSFLRVRIYICGVKIWKEYQHRRASFAQTETMKTCALYSHRLGLNNNRKTCRSRSQHLCFFVSV